MKKKGVQKPNGRLNNPFKTQMGRVRISGQGAHKNKKDKIHKKMTSREMVKGAIGTLSFNYQLTL